STIFLATSRHVGNVAAGKRPKKDRQPVSLPLDVPQPPTSSGRVRDDVGNPGRPVALSIGPGEGRGREFTHALYLRRRHLPGRGTGALLQACSRAAGLRPTVLPACPPAVLRRMPGSVIGVTGSYRLLPIHPSRKVA